MRKFAGKDSEVRTSDQIGQGSDHLQEHSSDEEDETSDFAEQQQDVMEAKNDFWSISGSFDDWELSGPWNGFAQSTIVTHAPPPGHLWYAGD